MSELVTKTTATSDVFEEARTAGISGRLSWSFHPAPSCARGLRVQTTDLLRIQQLTDARQNLAVRERSRELRRRHADLHARACAHMACVVATGAQAHQSGRSST